MIAQAARRLWSRLPSGGSLSDPLWQQRCRLLIGLTWLHAGLIALWGPVFGYRWEPDLAAAAREGTILHTAAEGLIVAFFAAVATWARASRTVQSIALALGLMSASAIMVHLSGGYIELHFHFFVMLVFLALLQDWLPFLLAVGYVLVHHGVVGVLWPEHVYNHPAAIAAPWKWAAIHALFVGCSCVGSILAWRLNEYALARTTLILEAAGEGIVGVDRSGHVIFMSQAAAAMLGITSRRAMGRPFQASVRLLHADGTAVAEHESPIRTGRPDGQPQHETTHWVERADGTRFPVDWRSTPVMEDDTVSGVVVTFEDTTERHHVAAAVRDVEEQLRQSQKMEAIGRLAGGVAHDFNNLLTVITAQMDLSLMNVSVSDPLRGRLQETKDAAFRAARLTSHLLAFSRKQILQATIQNLNDIVGGLAKMLPRLIGEDVVLATLLAPDIQNVRVDRGQVEQVVMNLVINARDAMPGGGRLTIETQNVDLDATYTRQHPGVTPGRYVMLAVSDTGCGMDEATRARIFEPFFTTKPPGQGTGLGLSTVYGIVAQSGGYIRVYSEPGRGSTFRSYFPAVSETVQMATPAGDQVPARGHETVLLVEDEEMLRRVAREVLEAQGYTVLVASNGHEAAQAAAQHPGPIHLLLTDVVMPGMSGRVVADRLAMSRPETKVLFMSGYTDGAIAHHGVLEPKMEYLAKPFSVETLSARVRDVLDAATETAARPISVG
ncbi:MAG TPA: ATP-binding protein [Methylomirabilota bacterium]|nr:ATP-binding protein [Methylomirabilota bacterium]